MKNVALTVLHEEKQFIDLGAYSLREPNGYHLMITRNFSVNHLVAWPDTNEKLFGSIMRGP